MNSAVLHIVQQTKLPRSRESTHPSSGRPKGLHCCTWGVTRQNEGHEARWGSRGLQPSTGAVKVGQRRDLREGVKKVAKALVPPAPVRESRLRKLLLPRAGELRLPGAGAHGIAESKRGAASQGRVANSDSRHHEAPQHSRALPHTCQPLPGPLSTRCAC